MKAKVKCICGRIHLLSMGESVVCSCSASVRVEDNRERWQPWVTVPADYNLEKRKMNKPKIVGLIE